MKKSRQGFTIIEIIVVLGILATILGIGYISLISVERRAPLTASVDTLVGDMQSQRTKAMIGDTQGGNSSDSYGILFQANQYVLFKGSVYNPNDVANSIFPLPTNITFSSISFPSSSIVFLKGSGEISGYAFSANTLTVKQNLSGEQKTITINAYGTITSIQ